MFYFFFPNRHRTSCRVDKIYQERGVVSSHRVHRVVTSAFWRTFSHEGKICLGCWGWGVHAYPILLHLPSPVKLQCGQIHWPYFISCKDMYSVFPAFVLIISHLIFSAEENVCKKMLYCAAHRTFYYFELCSIYLKVVVNENWGGSAVWLLIE